jgi:uncharacterized protein (DUF924 family)
VSFRQGSGHAPAWAGQVRDFWFGQPVERWWKADRELDAEIGKRFHGLWEEQRQRIAESFLGSSDEAVAAVILFDQFPRNMFRGHAEQFATDPLALAIAKGAIERGLDGHMSKDERAFLLMPFQHSENLGDQQRSLALFTELGNAEMLHYARLHHDVIERFGRFPHRNKILGRQPRPAEIEAGNVVPW